MSPHSDNAAMPSPLGRSAELDRTSLTDWIAGYEAGYSAGYQAAVSVLDDAATALAQLRPSKAVDIRHARVAGSAPGRRPTEPDHNDPTALSAYRARIYASWGLDPPDPDEPVTAPEADEQEPTS